MGSPMKRTQVAITGGAGRLGRHIADKLSDSCDLTIIDKQSSGGSDDVPIDVLDRGMLSNALVGQDAIIHLAAIDASVDASDHAFYETNTMAAWNVLELGYSAGIRQFVICSSSSVYGFSQSSRLGAPQSLPITEAQRCQPSTAYGLSKQVTELIAEAFSRKGDISVTVLRPCFVAFDNLLEQMTSEHQERDILLQRVDRRHSSEWVEPLPILRSWVDPESVAECFLCALKAELPGFHTFNVSSDDTFIADDTVTYIKTTFGDSPSEIDEAFYARQSRASVFDNRLAFELLGWRPRNDWPTYLKSRRAMTAV